MKRSSLPAVTKVGVGKPDLLLSLLNTILVELTGRLNKHEIPVESDFESICWNCPGSGVAVNSS